MMEEALENPISILEIGDLVPRSSRSLYARDSGNMLDDDALDRLCDAVLSSMSAA